MPLTAGQRLGPYEILAAIGAGGMGEVYRARDSRLDRDVAIKVLPEGFARDADRLARFEREAKALAALNHANIAHIHGLEEFAGVRALTMELVEGEDLSQRLRLGPIPIVDALPIAKQIADALEAAHEQGIIHRDLKPANVKLRPDGVVKILDFGLAKASDPAGASSADLMNSPTLTARATQMGVIVGTAAYMAPEQAKGRAVDKRADIWAFGVLLFEILTGRRGYDAEDASETLAAVLTREVDWTLLPAETPPRIRALIRDCLVRDPKQRLRDIGDARRVLDQAIGGAPDPVAAGSSSAVTTGPAGFLQRALPWTIAAVALLVAGGAVWKAISAGAAPDRIVTRSKLSVKEQAGFVELSRDGTRLAYTTIGLRGSTLAVRQMDQFEGQSLPGIDRAAFPIFSPAADWIAFGATDGKSIKKTPVTGGASITICEGNFLDGGAWGDDDTIVFARPGGLMRVSANGGTPQVLTTVNAAKGEIRHSRPQFLPGGRQVLFTLTSDSADSPQFAVLDLQKGGYRTVAKGGSGGRYAPTGHLTFVRGATLFAVPFDVAHLTVTGTEVPVVDSVSVTGPAGSADYAFSQTGVLVYTEGLTQGGSSLAWVDRKGAPQPLPGQLARSWGTGRLSPDGRRVANGILGGRGADIWVVDLSRGTSTRLTFDQADQNLTAIWSPDGRRIVYTGAKDGKTGIYSVPADGSGQPELVIQGGGVPKSFTPDGKTLLYTQGGSDRSRIMVLSMTGRATPDQPRLLREASAADTDAQVSPDGKWVAVTSNETGQPEVYVLPFPGPGPKVQISTQSGQRPRWAKNGRELFYWTYPATTLMSVLIQPAPFSPSAPREMFKAFVGTTWDVTSDGDHFLIETPGTQGGTTFATVTNWFDELRRRAPVK
jgi:serine/threonine-protein kinase